MTSQLQYLRLPLDGFRLLDLSVDAYGRLSGSLTTHSFEKPPSYIALSYVWGDRHGIRDLECTLDSNGLSGHVSVSASLYDSLVALHQQPLPLWVDALCINQTSDRVEKNDQVRKMHLIYQNATQVIAWLGGERGHSNLAMDVLTWLADTSLAQKPIFMWPPLLRTSTWLTPRNLGALRRVLEANVEIELREATFAEFGLPRINHQLWQGFADVFYRSWFSRLWTFEEVMLNSQNAVVHCGDRAVRWPSFFRLGMALSHTELLYNPNVQTPPQYQPEGIHSFTRLRSFIYPPDEGVWFWLYVREGRYKNVSKKVDRIYALRALARQQVRSEIPVEYALEDRFWLVYIRAAKVMMSHFTMQSILGQAESSERAPELPSWCPDFRHPPLSNSYGSSGRAGFGVPKSLRHNFENENVILVGGIVKASIIEVVRGFQWYWPERDYSTIWGPHGDASRIVAWMDRCRQLARQSFPSEHDSHSAWARTLLGDVPGANSPPYPPNAIDGLDLLYRRLRENQAGIRRENSVLSDADFLTMQPVMKYLGTLWRKKVFFRTSANQLGFSSLAAERNDQVTIFFGESHVHILRPAKENEFYQYIAPAYVHGLMLGEAIMTLPKAQHQHTLSIL